MPRTRRSISRSNGGRRTSHADREPDLAPAFDSLLRQARGLHADPNPVQAETFASSVVSTFPRRLVDIEDPEGFFGKRLVDHLVARRSDDGLALLHALAAIATSDALARLARAGAIRLKVAGRTDPPWAAIVGRSRFVEAWRPVDPYQEQDLVVATWEYEDGRRHALVTLVDQNWDGLARQAHIAGDPDDVRRAFLESGEMALEPLSAQAVADRLAQGLRMFDLFIDPPCDEDMPPLVPLLRARLRALPSPMEKGPREWTHEQLDMILDDFAASKEAGRSKKPVELASLFVDCRLERLDADPFRWSPIAVELCLLDWLPRKATLDAADTRAVPDALKRWIRYSGRRKGLPRPAIEETLAAVDQFTPDFGRAAADPSSPGPAKSLVDALMAEGVDLTDEQARDAWIAEFNARPSAERDAILGMAGGPNRRAQPRLAPERAEPKASRAGERRSVDDVAARQVWAIPPRRGTLRGVDLAFLDPSDSDDRSLLVEAEHPEFARALRQHEDVDVDGATVDPRLHLALHEIVAKQLWDGQPPETWAAAQRLTGLGFDRHDVFHALMRAVSDIVYAAMQEPLMDRTDDMRAALDALGRDGSKRPRRPPR